jgi:hypothetical protein
MMPVKASVLEAMITKATFGEDMTEVVIHHESRGLVIRTMDVASSRVCNVHKDIEFPDGEWGISSAERASKVLKTYKDREVKVKGDNASLQIVTVDKPKKQSKIPVEADVGRMLNRCSIEFLMVPNAIQFYHHDKGEVVSTVPITCKFKFKATDFKKQLKSEVFKDSTDIIIKFAGNCMYLLAEDSGFKEGAQIDGECMQSPTSATTGKYRGLKDLADVLEGDIIIAMGQNTPVMFYEEVDGIVASYGVMPYLE